MEIRKAIELLRQKSNEAVIIASLPYENSEYIPWRRNVEDILEMAFGVDSTEYKRFHNERVVVHSETRSKIVAQKGYETLIQRLQQEINSIIQKYEILGIETDSDSEQGLKETSISPTKLFDAMNFHTRIIEASRLCFVSGLYREAILNAFISFIDYVKERTGLLDLDGDDLINRVFSFEYDKGLKKIIKYPIIRINNLKTNNDRNEQEGFKYLCKGAAAFIRNPRAHKLIPQSNPFYTLENLSITSLLTRRVDEGTTLKPVNKKPKINEHTFINLCNEGDHKNAVILYGKVKKLLDIRKKDFINWGVSGYSYRMRWKGYPVGETIYTSLSDGKITIWPDLSSRTAQIGETYLERLRNMSVFNNAFRKHKYPTVSTDDISTSDIDAFVTVISELGESLDQSSGEV